MTKTLGLLGIPVETGQNTIGTGRAPDFIRGINLISDITRLGYDVTDQGNMDVVHVLDDSMVYKAKMLKTFKENTLKTKTIVEKTLKEKQIAVVLGGDRSVCTGSILAHQAVDKDICVVWVGRKPSLHTPLSSPTGNTNEMVFFLIISEMQNEIPWLPEFKTMPPIISANEIGLVGIHEVDNYERYIINKCGIKALSTKEVDRVGMSAVIRECLMTINPGLKKSIHLCLNSDVFDPLYGPCSTDCAPGGLTLRETITIGEFLFSTGNLRVMDVLEFNPRLGSDKDNDVTRRSLVETMLAVLGATRQGVPQIDPNFYMWQQHNISRRVYFP